MPSLIAGAARPPFRYHDLRSKVVPRSSTAICKATKKITLLPGDGIGPEITAATVKVLKVRRAWSQIDLTRS